MREVIQYIELPGQDPAEPTYLGVNNKIVLQKYRDIIIKVKLLPSMSYKVSANLSDFYNARDKKIIRQGSSVEFKDGERLHLWVGKSFKGVLRIKSSNDKVIGYYPVADCDSQQCGTGLLDKPAPFMILLGNQGAAPFSAAPPQNTSSGLAGYPSTGAGSTNLGYLSSPNFPSSIPNIAQMLKIEAPEIMHVIEAKKPPPAGEPETDRILKFFSTGGEETAVDSKGILTRNWLWAQIAGAASYVKDNKKWIDELWGKSFRIQKIIHKSGAKYYIIFKGWPALRTFMSAAQYGVANTKVLSITSGAATGAALRHAWGAAKESVKKAGAVAVAFTIALDVAEWYQDYSQIDPKTGKPKKDFNDLFAKIGVDIVKALGSAALASLVMGGAISTISVASTGLVAFGILTTAVSVPIAVVVVGTIFAAVLIGYGFDWLDKEFGITETIADQLRTISKPLEDKNPSDYKGYTDAMGAVYGGGL